LLRAVGRAALERDTAQIVVVTARLDEAKRAVLAGSGLSVASEWWVRLAQRPNDARRASPVGGVLGPVGAPDPERIPRDAPSSMFTDAGVNWL